ncbi:MULTISPECIES: ribonuclease D [Rhodanobacter]|uniref:Ribonuclease D n=1 Tax=Rhodanobacter denitrificans TaxID=666685 RepID=M4NPD8_9GAMM|nr:MULTISPECIES: ribonuclease D [Rhodanobacter]AGG89506.1 ribonuclease D [Rhodanobacter denitrificans]UJJ49706.1 ribonuclease D [Rhodanobacter denitrificans]UJM88385.1 ribonuclease D [Rhodanobacter denitrificans]UJM92420.1 ribonuclease D [Rhodanobacter denitrificans]UJM95950.1 ribonuclease D [Rhodanobacter denitrificans]
MSPPETAAADWINRPDALQAWLAAIPADAAVGLDTEFMRRNTFYPQLALLQLGWNGRHALIDPLAFDIGAALQPLLGADGAMTIMHSAGEDLETLAPLLPEGPGRLFDTQIAAAFAGMGLGLSYRALVAELTGVDLDKGETRSDWLQRPLTESQRAYATLDVVYLKTLHERLAERLQRRDRSAWHAEDCARLKQRASRRDGDPQPQRALRGAADWPVAQQALLRRLLLWRERSARRLDVPRPWLLDDALALNLAQQPPRSLGDLEQRGRGQRALRSAQRGELFELLAAAVGDEEIAATARIPGHPQGEAKKALAAMKTLIDHRADELDLPPGLLCPRKVLEEYVVTAEWPDFLDGWRREVLHDRLPGLLPG